MPPANQSQKSVTLAETRVEKGAACPHCGHGEGVRNGVVSGLQHYRCKGCGRCLNALTGKPLARLHHKEKRRGQAEAMIDGHSVRKTALKLGVHRTTAFRWRHKFLAWPAGLQTTVLSGIAESDET